MLVGGPTHLRSRPGARREAFETYVKRSRSGTHCVELQSVDKVFAIRLAARFACSEPEDVDDVRMTSLSTRSPAN